MKGHYGPRKRDGGEPPAKRRNPGVRELLACCRANDFEGALEKYNPEGLDGSAFASVLAVCSGVSRDHIKGQVWTEKEMSETKKRREFAFQVFQDMRDAGVQASEATFTMLIRACCVDRALDEAVATLDKMKADGLKLKLRTYSPLLRLACKLSSKRALEIRDDAVKNDVALGEDEYVALAEACDDPKILEDMALDVHVPKRGAWRAAKRMFPAWTATEDVDVSADGVCSACGMQLRSVDLSVEERDQLLSQIDGLVIDGALEQQHNPSRAAQWTTFKNWMHDKHYDAIIDGANVGYYNQNNATCVDFRQIDLVLRKCAALGKSPLVVLHARHLDDDRVNATPGARDLVKSWRRSNYLYSCCLRNNDDWYWLYAAVKGGDRSWLVSNDEMRDHHFKMLSRRAFLVWKERHLTKFSFGPWLRSGSREVILSVPPAFSVRMQQDIHGTSWHIPASDDGNVQQDTVVVARPDIASLKWLCLVHPKDNNNKPPDGPS